MNELEREIEESRARLDQTIDRIQGRLSVPNLVDEMLGNARRTPLAGTYDGALEAVRRNPVPVLMIAAGVGWLIHRMSRDAERTRTRATAERVPSLPADAVRSYDPDAPAGQPSPNPADAQRL